MKPIQILIFGLFSRLFLAGYVAWQGWQNLWEPDAQGFYLEIVYIALTQDYLPLKISQNSYLNSMGYVASLLGDGFYLICFLSCVGWFVSALFFLSSVRILGVSEKATRILCVIYAFLPGPLALTSIPLREPFQLLFVNMAIYGLLHALLEKRPAGWIFALVGAFCAGTMHGALTALGVILIGGGILVKSMLFDGKFITPQVVVIGFVAIISAPFVAETFSGAAYDVSSGMLESIAQYQTSGLKDARAQYKDVQPGVGVVASIIIVPQGFFQYLFEPFPWKIGSISDIYLLFENILRAIFIIMAFILCRRVKSHERIVVLWLFATYAAHELIWSLGTINWGTALRHHVPIMGVQLLMVARWRRFPKSPKNLILGTRGLEPAPNLR